MGAVYEARDEQLDLEVALKVIRPDVTADPRYGAQFVQRFKRNCSRAPRSRTATSLRIHDLGEAGGTKFITMAYVRGHRSGGPPRLAPADVRGDPVVRQAAERRPRRGARCRDRPPRPQAAQRPGGRGRHDLHLRFRTGQVARGHVAGPHVAAATARHAAVHLTGQVEGRPAGPPQRPLRPRPHPVRAGDRQVPFMSESTIETLMRRVRETPCPLNEAAPETPEFFCQVVMRCLAKDPAARTSGRPTSWPTSRPNAGPSGCLRRRPRRTSVASTVPATAGVPAPSRVGAGCD